MLNKLKICWFMMAYHQWWRLKPYSLLTFNECIALTSIVGLALGIALGPLSRLLHKPTLLPWRRPFGVAGAVCGLIHAGMVLFVLQEKFFQRSLHKQSFEL